MTYPRLVWIVFIVIGLILIFAIGVNSQGIQSPVQDAWVNTDTGRLWRGDRFNPELATVPECLAHAVILDAKPSGRLWVIQAIMDQELLGYALKAGAIIVDTPEWVTDSAEYDAANYLYYGSHGAIVMLLVDSFEIAHLPRPEGPYLPWSEWVKARIEQEMVTGTTVKQWERPHPPTIIERNLPQIISRSMIREINNAEKQREQYIDKIRDLDSLIAKGIDWLSGPPPSGIHARWSCTEAELRGQTAKLMAENAVGKALGKNKDANREQLYSAALNTALKTTPMWSSDAHWKWCLGVKQDLDSARANRMRAETEIERLDQLIADRHMRIDRILNIVTPPYCSTCRWAFYRVWQLEPSVID